MTTFSQLVDKMLHETKRPDLLAETCTYLNQTIREVHFEPERGNVVHYNSNRREDQIVTTNEHGQIWDIPNPATFQGVEAVRFASLYLQRMEFAKEVNPGPAMQSEPFYWYRSGPSLVFGGTRGYGGIGATIQLSWFEYPRALKYRPLAEREASWDDDSGWTYKTANTPEERALARERVTNWLLERWGTVIEEGLRAKVYKRLGDEVRQRTSYSLYSQLRRGLFTSEVAELAGG